MKKNFYDKNGRTPREELDTLKANYQDGQQIYYIDDEDESQVLESFRFPADVIRQMIDNEYTELFFAIGYHKDYSMGNSRFGHTLIAIGLGHDRKLDLDESDDNIIHNVLISTKYDTENPTKVLSNTTLTNVRDVVLEYRTNHKSQVSHADESTLKGFTIDIEELLIHCLLGAKHIDLHFGYHTNATAHNTNIGYTLLSIGVDDGGLLKMGPKDYIFDYCDPCPKICPTNINLLTH